MPDIFKKQEFVETEDAVKIPDVEFYIGPIPLEDGSEDPSGGQAAQKQQQSVEAKPHNTQREVFVAPVVEPAKLSREQLEDIYADELEQIRRDAAEQAYSDALKQKKGEFKECITQVDRTLAELKQIQDEYVEQYTRELKYLAIDIAEKIMLQRIAENDMNLCAMVLQAISSVKHSKWLSVDLSERLVNLVDYMKKEVQKPEYHGRADINPMACPDDTCRVNTEDGTVVSTITVQTNKLREAFANAEQEELGL